ncbi:hypothetical protein HDV00_012648 [Rhizophlyctis rosea]|nr:hypothetical protein HDV00_012648 [Rhizophlyctis rosea]
MVRSTEVLTPALLPNLKLVIIKTRLLELPIEENIAPPYDLVTQSTKRLCQAFTTLTPTHPTKLLQLNNVAGSCVLPLMDYAPPFYDSITAAEFLGKQIDSASESETEVRDSVTHAFYDMEVTRRANVATFMVRPIDLSPQNSLELSIEANTSNQLLRTLTPHEARTFTLQNRTTLAAHAVHTSNTTALHLLLTHNADPLPKLTQTTKTDHPLFPATPQIITLLTTHYAHSPTALTTYFWRLLYRSIEAFAPQQLINTIPLLLPQITLLQPHAKPLIYQWVYSLFQNIRDEEGQFNRSWVPQLLQILSLPTAWMTTYLPTPYRLIAWCLPRAPANRFERSTSNGGEAGGVLCRKEGMEMAKVILSKHICGDPKGVFTLLELLRLYRDRERVKRSLFSPSGRFTMNGVPIPLPPPAARVSLPPLLRDGACAETFKAIALEVAKTHVKRRREVVKTLWLVRLRGRSKDASEELRREFIVFCEMELFRLVCEYTGWSKKLSEEDVLREAGFECF